MTSSVVISISALINLLFRLKGTGIRPVLEARLADYFGDLENCNVAMIFRDYEAPSFHDVYKIQAPDVNWFVSMKLAPTELETILLNHIISITYKD